jgi:hypothetical protein
MVLHWRVPQSSRLSDKSGVTVLTCMAFFAAERYFAV